jgi:hypothetical protein
LIFRLRFYAPSFCNCLLIDFFNDLILTFLSLIFLFSILILYDFPSHQLFLLALHSIHLIEPHIFLEHLAPYLQVFALINQPLPLLLLQDGLSLKPGELLGQLSDPRIHRILLVLVQELPPHVVELGGHTPHRHGVGREEGLLVLGYHSVDVPVQMADQGLESQMQVLNGVTGRWLRGGRF